MEEAREEREAFLHRAREILTGVAGAEKIFEADCGQGDDSDRGKVIEDVGYDCVGAAMRVPFDEIEEAVEAKHGGDHGIGSNSHAKRGDKDAEHDAEEAGDLSPVGDLDPEESGYCRDGDPGENLETVAYGKTGTLALHVKQGERKRDSWNVQRHGQNDRNDDAESIAQAAAETARIGREL